MDLVPVLCRSLLQASNGLEEQGVYLISLSQQVWQAARVFLALAGWAFHAHRQDMASLIDTLCAPVHDVF